MNLGKNLTRRSLRSRLRTGSLWLATSVAVVGLAADCGTKGHDSPGVPNLNSTNSPNPSASGKTS
ncbi:hypothetical protein PWY87_33230 [Kribbella solani]|uniref:hypothetical protein n=1 Tax=Kribbella solani TaxID=236067 RepID=UPI0029B61013|nr:hypothetical protein [Kribbella solani]MDX3006585.1 hypothetical protein [Kribbella solani]